MGCVELSECAENRVCPGLAEMVSSPKIFMRLAGLFLVALVSACATTQTLEPFKPVLSQEGTLVWSRGAETFRGRVTADRAPNGAARLRFYRETLQVEVRLEPDNRGTAEGSILPGAWRGPVRSAPAQLGTWFDLAEAYIASPNIPNGQHEVHGPEYRAAYDKTEGRLRSLSVRNSQSGEVLTAYFTN